MDTSDTSLSGPEQALASQDAREISRELRGRNVPIWTKTYKQALSPAYIQAVKTVLQQLMPDGWQVIAYAFPDDQRILVIERGPKHWRQAG